MGDLSNILFFFFLTIFELKRKKIERWILLWSLYWREGIESCEKKRKGKEGMNSWGLWEHNVKDFGGLKSKRKEATFIIVMTFYSHSYIYISATPHARLTCIHPNSPFTLKHFHFFKYNFTIHSLLFFNFLTLLLIILDIISFKATSSIFL